MKTLLVKLGIHDKESFLKFCMQFLKFGIVGFSNTVISLAIYYLFVWINPGWYLWGNAIGFVVSVANAYFWSRKYVFKESKPIFWNGLFKSYAAYGASFLISTGLLFLQIELFFVSEKIAPIFNLIVTIPLNFLVNKFWTFR